jgi:hypothetical protein
MHRRIPAKLLAPSLLLLLAFVPSVALAADNSSCQLLSWNPNYPVQVTPGEGVQVASTIDIACGQWRTFYSARLDLVDRSTGRLISTSTFQIGWNPNYTTTVSNLATAPQSDGEWKLLLNLYIFEEAGLVTSFKNAFNINVGSSMTASTSSTTNEQSAMQAISMQQNTSTEQPAVLETNTVTNTTPSAISPILYFVLGVAVAAIVAVGILLMTRKHHS